MLPYVLPQPDIHLFGIRIQEPMTTLTDLLVTAVCFYAYWKLNQAGNSGKTVYFKKIYFVLMGFATLFGGLIGHAFQYALGTEWKLLGWITSMVAVMLIERSAIEYTINLIPPKWHRFLLWLNITELIIILLLTIYTLNFKFVEFHAVWGFMIVVFTFHLFTFLKTKDAGSRLMLYGIAVLAGAMFVFNYPVAPHQWFTHSDLSHVLMAIASYLFLKATLAFGDPPKQKLGSNAPIN
ncbi:MAG: hypothetical protein AAF573_16810 [Bacteroidota bacterium]